MDTERLRRLREARPTRYHRPPPQPLRGPFAPNEGLGGAVRFGFAQGTFGPESLAVDRDGTLVTGFDDGRIMRFSRRGGAGTEVVHTGGRPLGLRFHPDGSLLVCDAKRGLLQVSREGVVRVLADHAEGTRIGFADDLDVDRSGRYVYFTDASTRWPYGEDRFDLIEHAGCGRFLRYDFDTGETSVLMEGLQFANGVTLGPDDAYVLVVETGMYRVHRYWLKGAAAGTHEVWIDKLPGFPDNVRFNGRDCFWVAVPAPRNLALELLAGSPRARWMLLQVLGWVPPPVAHLSMVLGFDLEGRLVHNLQSRAKDAYHFITQALEHEGELLLSSLERESLARVPLR